MKKIILAALAAAMLAGCGQAPQKPSAAPAVNGSLDIKIPCKSAEWEAITTVEEGKNITSVKSRVYFRAGRFRFEILNPQSGNKQVILLDQKKLYVLGYDNTAYMYDANQRETEVFLRKIFINTGLARKPEIKTGEDVYNGQKCSVYEYEILRNINGLYAKAVIKEWRSNRGATVKMEGNILPSEFKFGERKVIVGPIKETYETSGYKCGENLMGMLFEVPMGMKIVDQQAEYMLLLKKSGKKITPDVGMVTITVRAKQKK